MKQKSYGFMLALYSLVAWVASGTLVLERLELFKNPHYTPSCDFGLFLSCSTIMKTEQAALFGFPNPLLGLAGFAITGTIGVILLTGATLPKWFHRATLLGLLVTLVMVGYFWYTSVIVVMTLCPWCMIVWAVVIPMFFHSLNYQVRQGVLGNSLKNKEFPPFWVSTIVAYFIILASIVVRFYEYIFT